MEISDSQSRIQDPQGVCMVRRFTKGMIKKNMTVARMFNAGQDTGYYTVNSSKVPQINLMAWFINIG